MTPLLRCALALAFLLSACDGEAPDPRPDRPETSLDAQVVADAAPPGDAGIEEDAATDGGAPDLVRLGERKAFPTAHGYGAYTSGGRGGRVIEVTSLDETGPGTLAEAMSASGPRVIVFATSGYIDWSAIERSIREPNVSILGQTAPAPGITLRHSTLRVSASEVILRHLRVRRSNRDGRSNDALRIIRQRDGEPLRHVIADHCSLSWGTDENLSFGGRPTSPVSDVTVQHCLLAEGLNHYQVLIAHDTARISLIRNLFAHTDNRIPENTYGRGEVYEFNNNIVFDYNRATTIATVATVDVIGNVYKSGPVPPERTHNVTFNVNRVENPDASLDDAEVYGADNLQVGADVAEMYDSRFMTHARDRRAHEGSLYDPIPASELEGALLEDVGASRARDAVDERVLQDYRDGTGVRGLDTIDEVGGFPPLAVNVHPDSHDANGNHVADDFEAAHGIDDVLAMPETFTLDGVTFDNREYAGGSYRSASGATANAYTGGELTGARLYTWREIYWAWLAGDFAPSNWGR
ncbi:MAG: hypothetical protein VYE22_24315 [Myxococcota bacterium]|nr:hypothetical protein [Myxococcota bacterium]